MKAVLRYLGAKNRLADWIVSFFPEHKIYVEPYGGSAAALLNKAPVEIEVYNDLYDDVVNLFRIIRSERYVELMEQVNMTPFSEREYDSPDTLFYLDPPYMHETRTKDGRYAFEYDHGDHERLLRLVAGLKGKVVLSGYDNSLYASMLPGWRVEKKATESMRRSQRIECLWLNYNPQLTLF